MVLEIDGLEVHARTAGGVQPIVRSASLSVAPGEIVGVVGESGSGKTTLVRAVIGLLDRNVRVVSGSVSIDGERVVDPAVIRGSRVGMVFQDATRSLNPLLKVSTQLREVLARHRPDLPDAVMAGTLRRMAIEDVDRVLGSYPHELSGGLCQRVAIAMAVVTEPRLILADECTTALDVTTQAEVVALLRKLATDAGIGLVFVTHDLLLAADLCDRIAVMSDGAIVESAATAELIGRPREAYTRQLLAAVPAWS